MNHPGTYENVNNPESSWAVIILPEIFGLNRFITKAVDTYASTFQCLAYAFDQNYIATGKEQIFEYEADFQAAIDAKAQLDTEKFVAEFTHFIDELQTRYPNVTEIIVVGYCFGGRLAYLTGVDARVTHIISYYGAGPHEPQYYHGMGPVEALAKARADDTNLHVLAFYGAQDSSIPSKDHGRTKQLLDEAHIDYSFYVFDAPHAFANFERSFFNQEATEQAWQHVLTFLA